jgi:hypothetical protein
MSKREKWLIEKKYEEIGLEINHKNRNKVFPLNEHSSEDWFHFIVKAMVFDILRRKGKTVLTEAHFRKLKAEADVFDVDDGIVYEIESNLTKNKRKRKLEQFSHPLITEVFFVDLSQMPKTITGLRKRLTAKVCW